MARSPPTYDEAIQMDGLCPASAPLLETETSGVSSTSSLDRTFYSLPETVNFSLGTEGPDTFYIRDTRNCVLVRGISSPGSVYLSNANGEHFLRINTNRIPVDEDVAAARAEHVRKSTVLHDRCRLGTVECSESDLSRISVSNLYDKYDFLINCMGGGGDIVISKARNTPPLCTVNIPSGQGPFNATLVFPTVSLVTKVEQCLCIATIITFIMTRNDVLANRNSSSQFTACFCCFIICVVIGLLGWLFISWLQSEECQLKPYRCRKN